MSEKLTNILGYTTLIALLAAIWVLFGEDPTLEQGGRGEKLFPELEATIDTVSVIRIGQGGDDKVTLLSGDTGWTVQERNGYAADPAKVRDILRGLFQSTRREPKTDNQDRMDRIGLDESALDVRLLAAAETPLATVKIGTRKEGATGRSLTYVLKKEDSRSWLVSDIPELSENPAWWIVPDVYAIDPDRVASLDFGRYTLVRADTPGDMILSEIAQGETAKTGYQVSEPLRVLTSLQVEDVQKLSNPIVDPVTSIALTTFDGLDIDFAIYQLEESFWLQVRPSYDPAKLEQDASVSDAVSDAAVDAETVAQEFPGAPQDGAAEAAELTADTAGWLYKLSPADAVVLLRDRSEYVEAAAPEQN
ncbi:hypothetical protein GCM10017044_00500 [Kordiimonas sediminis]|uniref:DUF4340 domain-containing protein n=1 Tax=Kordiimonas sediminis TaxID=1735581 RepID=A0A919AJP2_9PROT|nr:DUF4340 domain-containing protein [Kordiimonas sediminis]GHF10722.1 hypothetical protein GCM10017044_00500 [Kordiimonas sediminis]